jgi:hypothetical protein
MSVIRSGQKNLEEIQRIRAAMEGKQPVVSEAQRMLLEEYAGILGEDGQAMLEAIEEEVKKSKKMPADVFREIESCLQALGQRAKRQEKSNEVIKRREPERLLQLEAIREHTNRLHGARFDGDKPAEESIRDAALKLVGEFMTAVDKDKEEGLDLDTARLWRAEVRRIAEEGRLDLTSEEGSRGAAGPSATAGTDHLAPLKSLIEQATFTMQAAAREVQDPDETVLRGFGNQLGSSKKEIMTLSKDLVINQPTGVAMEASRLAGETCDAIKESRKAIRAALRDMGAASDISEASRPTRAQPAPVARPPALMLAGLGWGTRQAGSSWVQRPPPTRPAVGEVDPPEWLPDARPAAAGWPPTHTPATTAWPPADPPLRPKMRGADGELSALMRGMMDAQANDSGWPTFSGKYVEYPRFRKEWWAYRQTYHGHVRDELVCRSLKERSLASNVRMLVNDIDDLKEAWSTLDTASTGQTSTSRKRWSPLSNSGVTRRSTAGP